MQNNTLQIFNERYINQSMLNISGMDITGYINFDKFINTIEIKCHENCISKIEGICTNIKKLHCYKNRLMDLDSLNDDFLELEELDCSRNYIVSLDNLPLRLIKLNCSANNIVSLDNLPEGLMVLVCSHTYITNLDNLPLGLIELVCSHNKNLTQLDYLPYSVKNLEANSNPKLKQLSNLPNSIEKIVFNTEILILPIPKNTKLIFCSEKGMDLNKIKKYQYKHSKKNFKFIK
jgi:Leucine-rich repeat (LRR) protein